MNDLRLAKICAWMRDDYPLEDIQEAFDSLADRPQDLKTQIVMNP